MIQIQAEALNGTKTQALADLGVRSRSYIEGGKNMVKLGPVVGEVLMNIAKNSIDLKFQSVQERNLEDMEDIKEYEACTKRIIEIQHKLYSEVPEEMHSMLDDYEELQLQLLSSDIRYYFKEGVKAGLTDLKCLKEIGQAIVLL